MMQQGSPRKPKEIYRSRATRYEGNGTAHCTPVRETGLNRDADGGYCVTVEPEVKRSEVAN